ncbi:MAG: MurR/RpiR family transcriptional regulator [Psychrilyobacter sp.]|uniref:MurR/RpiR family transcriptional regulator n=1 Tax=Psychrilyobacter sp. TaxID=2586924 RepID=UPI003C7307B1
MTKFNENERKVIKFIQENPNEAIQNGISKLSKRLFVSSSSIFRISKKLGYDGFTDMVHSIKNEKDKDRNKSFGVSNTLNILDEKDIDTYIKYLTTNKIVIYGKDFSAIIGKYIQKRLFTLGINSHFIDCIDFNLFLETIGKEYDTMILISNTGECQDCLNLLENSNGRYKVISFTGKKKNTIANYSDVSFVFQGISTSDLIVKSPNPFYGNVILGFEELLKKV